MRAIEALWTATAVAAFCLYWAAAMMWMVILPSIGLLYLLGLLK
jgi:hypothetical protein